jgi:hypothetical protein
MKINVISQVLCLISASITHVYNIQKPAGISSKFNGNKHLFICNTKDKATS